VYLFVHIQQFYIKKLIGRVKLIKFIEFIHTTIYRIYSHHDISEILLTVVLNINQSINTTAHLCS